MLVEDGLLGVWGSGGGYDYVVSWVCCRWVWGLREWMCD